MKHFLLFGLTISYIALFLIPFTAYAKNTDIKTPIQNIIQDQYSNQLKCETIIAIDLSNTENNTTYYTFYITTSTKSDTKLNIKRSDFTQEQQNHLDEHIKKSKNITSKHKTFVAFLFLLLSLSIIIIV